MLFGQRSFVAEVEKGRSCYSQPKKLPSGGPMRKYYSLLVKGDEELEELKKSDSYLKYFPQSIEGSGLNNMEISIEINHFP